MNYPLTAMIHVSNPAIFNFVIFYSLAQYLSLPVLIMKLLKEVNQLGGVMRNYTYLGGARFTVNNLFRSLRFDIDRLDMSWVDGEKPEFSRGLRVVDNDEVNTVTVDGEDGDNLIYSLTYIFSKEDGADNFRAATDEYLKVALETKEFLVTNQKKDPEGNPKVVEAVIH